MVLFASSRVSFTAAVEGLKPSMSLAQVAFAVGSWCSARVRLYHSCLHFKRQVQEQVEERLGPLIEAQSRGQLSNPVRFE